MARRVIWRKVERSTRLRKPRRGRHRILKVLGRGSCRRGAMLAQYLARMTEPPYRIVAVASTFSPRFLQVLAEAHRVRERLCRELQLIYVGQCDEETSRKFSEA